MSFATCSKCQFSFLVLENETLCSKCQNLCLECPPAPVKVQKNRTLPTLAAGPADNAIRELFPQVRIISNVNPDKDVLRGVCQACENLSWIMYPHLPCAQHHLATLRHIKEVGKEIPFEWNGKYLVFPFEEELKVRVLLNVLEIPFRHVEKTDVCQPQPVSQVQQILDNLPVPQRPTGCQCPPGGLCWCPHGPDNDEIHIKEEIFDRFSSVKKSGDDSVSSGFSLCELVKEDPDSSIAHRVATSDQPLTDSLVLFAPTFSPSPVKVSKKETSKIVEFSEVLLKDQNRKWCPKSIHLDKMGDELSLECQGNFGNISVNVSAFSTGEDLYAEVCHMISLHRQVTPVLNPVPQRSRMCPRLVYKGQRRQRKCGHTVYKGGICYRHWHIKNALIEGSTRHRKW